MRRRQISESDGIRQLDSELKLVNERLWEVEDELRLCEQVRDFGLRFIELARSVYQLNDRRSLLKRRINEQLRSPMQTVTGWESDLAASYKPAQQEGMDAFFAGLASSELDEPVYYFVENLASKEA